MRFLADENVPLNLVTAIEQAGHDIASVGRSAFGLKDREVLSWAVREERVLLTFDKDFGELALHSTLPNACGVILLRVSMAAATLGSDLAGTICRRRDWPGHFSVIEANRIRMRPLL
jgi:predicted nuclease of predicted toxin-antitoxin system